jgi:soluble lytic murein transglycosylase-like protein
MENKLPWEEAALASSSHSELYNKRATATNQEEQNTLANYEHRAFTREAVADNPLMAVPLAVAIPGYQATKAMGMQSSRSEPSMAQAGAAYKGIGEGLSAAAKKPWEEAVEATSRGIERIASAGQAVSKAVNNLLPWEEAKEYRPIAPKIKPVVDRFEEVFSRLTKQESGNRHIDTSGKMITSPKGAQGVTQVMPKTGTDPGYGVEPLKNKSQEEYTRFGRDYLKAMIKEFNGDYEKALAAYNAGAGNVKEAVEKGGAKWKDFLPKKSETIPYINKILGNKDA